MKVQFYVIHSSFKFRGKVTNTLKCLKDLRPMSLQSKCVTLINKIT